MSRSVEPTITLTRHDNYWVAIHEPTNVGAQGETRTKALAELDEAIALHTNDATEPLDNEEEVLHELGIDPTEMPATPEEADDLPEFME